MKVAVIIEGGVVQTVLSDQKGVELVIVDYDTHDLEEEEITTILGNKSYIYGGIENAEVNKEQIDRIFRDAGRCENNEPIN